MAVGRTDTLQELINLLEEYYQETIIGSDINLIKHLFFFLKFESAEFIFEYDDRIMPVVVNEVYQEHVDLKVLGFEEGMSRRAKIKFEIINVLYVFEVIIDDIKGEVVKIKLPTELQSAEMRKYRRVICDDLFMNFTILFKSVKAGKYASGDTTNADSQFTHLFREIKNDNPDIKLMNKMVTDYIMNVSHDYEIIIYNESNMNDKNTMLMHLLSTNRKSIYIPDCSVVESYIDEMDRPDIKNFRELYLFKTQEIGEFKSYKFFEKMRKDDNRIFLVSYVISPLVIIEKVIGHIMVYTTAMDKHMITASQAEYIHDMTGIYSYGLTKIAIKGNRFNQSYRNIKVVDISISGLLFEITDEGLFRYLKKPNNNLIKMEIPIDKYVLKMSGEIVRYSVAEGAFHIGVNFLESNPDDMKILETYIFERKGNVLSE